MKLIRRKEQEEPNRNLIFWFEVENKDTIISVFNEEGNNHARITTGTECIKVGYPFAYITEEKEEEIKDSIINFIERNNINLGEDLK